MNIIICMQVTQQTHIPIYLELYPVGVCWQMMQRLHLQFYKLVPQQQGPLMIAVSLLAQVYTTQI